MPADRPSAAHGRTRRLVLAAATVGAVLLLALCGLPLTGLSGLFAGATATVAVAAAVLPWPSRRVDLAAAGSIAAASSLLLDAAYQGQPVIATLWLPIEFTALLVLMPRVIRRSPLRTATVAGALVGLAVVLLPLRVTLRLPKDALESSVLMCSATLVAAGCAAGIGLYLRSVDQRRVRAVEQARRAQRLDLAQDLHDLVAHEVTGIVLEAQASRVAAYDPEQARALFGRIEEAGLRALDSMDDMVSALRGPGEPAPLRVYGLGDLPDVVARFSTTGTIRAELNVTPGLALPAELDGAAYRVVVEALTNIRRHAPTAERVAVAVTRVADAVQVSIVDSGGPGGGQVERSGGTGLVGLAERVEALGGSLLAGPYGPGWRVTCTLPAPQGSPGSRLTG